MIPANEGLLGYTFGMSPNPIFFPIEYTVIHVFIVIIVCDVLPLVLSVPLPEVQYKQLVRWMQKSIEFFIMYITQPGSGDSPAVLSPGIYY